MSQIYLYNWLEYLHEAIVQLIERKSNFSLGWGKKTFNRVGNVYKMMILINCLQITKLDCLIIVEIQEFFFKVKCKFNVLNAWLTLTSLSLLVTIWRDPRHYRSPPSPRHLLSWENSASEVSSLWLLAARPSRSSPHGDNCWTSHRRVWLCLAPGTLAGAEPAASLLETWGEAWLPCSAPRLTPLSVVTGQGQHSQLAGSVCPPVSWAARWAAVSGTCWTCWSCCCCWPRWSGWWG